MITYDFTDFYAVDDFPATSIGKIYIFFNKNVSLCELTRLGMIKHITFAHAHFFFEDGFITRKMVPITGRVRSFLLVF